jgi:dihydrofolate reductase
MVRFQGKAHGFRKTQPVQKIDRMDLIIVVVSRRGDGMWGFFVSHLRPFEQAGQLNRDRHKGKDQESQIQLSIYIWSGFHSVSAKSNRSGCVNASPGPLICRGAFSYMNPFKAIAAMSENRVIGRENGIPWHLPEDFKWFKKMTTGQVLVMGRKTFESIGKPLPDRITLVLSRSPFEHPGVRTISGLDRINPADPTLAGRDIYVCGGAQVYAQALPLCSDLYLTLVKRIVPGDTFLPPFENRFELFEEILDRPDFKILHYKNRAATPLAPPPASSPGK